MVTAADDNRVIIDSEFTRLNVLYKGRYTGTEEGGLSSSTYFPATITTQEPPLVFVRPDTVNAIVGLSNLQIFGSPGAWTGFRVRVFNIYTVPPNGRWFAAVFGAVASATYGLRMWDANSKVIFDSGSPTALFVKTSGDWVYTGTGTTPQGQSINYFDSPLAMAEDEFLMINNFYMPLNTVGITQARDIGLMWNVGAQKLSAAAIGIRGYNVANFCPAALVARLNK